MKRIRFLWANELQEAVLAVGLFWVFVVVRVVLMVGGWL